MHHKSGIEINQVQQVPTLSSNTQLCPVGTPQLQLRCSNNIESAAIAHAGEVSVVRGEIVPGTDETNDGSFVAYVVVAMNMSGRQATLLMNATPNGTSCDISNVRYVTK